MQVETYGIAGLGVAGRSMLRFFSQYPDYFSQTMNNLSGQEKEWKLAVFEEASLKPEDADLLATSSIPLYTSWNDFINSVDSVWLSTGLSEKKFAVTNQKIIKEVDLFAALWKLPIISITGSLGKTTLTQLLYELLQQDSCWGHDEQIEGSCTHRKGCSYSRMALAGNIGVGLLDLIPHQELYHGAVLELSSWQLQESTLFAPSIGLWTNLYENHLDRHETLEAYFYAKAAFLRHQKATDIALLGSFMLDEKNRLFFEQQKDAWHGRLILVFDRDLTEKEEELLQEYALEAVFMRDQMLIHCFTHGNSKTIFSFKDSILEGFTERWVFALSTLYFLNKNLLWLNSELMHSAYQSMLAKVGKHRLQFVGKKKGIDFYNDSKSTLIQTTIAAVEELKKKYERIILILGGQSKGADQTPLKEYLAQESKLLHVLSFGELWKDFSHAQFCTTLDQAFEKAVESATSGDVILLSPSGASFDLYANYKARGDHFIRLVEGL